MIKSSDIKEILKQYQSEASKVDWHDNFVHDYYYIKDDKFNDVAIAILELTTEQAQEVATLSAKVKAYEAIIENSNFKMAIRGVKNNVQ